MKLREVPLTALILMLVCCESASDPDKSPPVFMTVSSGRYLVFSAVWLRAGPGVMGGLGEGAGKFSGEKDKTFCY